MDNPGTVVIVGGTSEIGKQLGMYYHDRGYVVALTSRDAKRAQAVAKELGDNAYGLALDLADPAPLAFDHEHTVATENENDIRCVEEQTVLPVYRVCQSGDTLIRSEGFLYRRP